ncbi:TrmB family transcriptional regulator [candidate division KSB1 bacterium]
MDISSLKEAGLTEGEIKVYLALLEIGSSTTGPIVDKSGISRSIIYQILEKLMEKAIVSMITKERTRYYQAAEPKKIIEYIDKREKNLKKNKLDVEKLLPQLLLKQKMAPKSQVNMYMGWKGIQTAHENSYLKLKRGDEYYYTGVSPEQPEFQHAYWRKDHVKRIKAGIRCKILFNKNTPKEVLKNRNSYWGCDARYMHTDIKTPSYFAVFKDTVMIAIPIGNPVAIEMISKEIADSFKVYFDEFWERSKSFKP